MTTPRRPRSYDEEEREKRKRMRTPTAAMEKMAESRGVTLTPRAHLDPSEAAARKALRENPRFSRQERYASGQYPVEGAGDTPLFDRIIIRILGLDKK